MKTCIFTTLAATLLLSVASTAAYAQNPSADQEKGSTGWSGGAKDQPSQQQGNSTTGQAVVHDEAKAKDQPLTATGEDLKGKPERFAPSKTPE